MANVALWAAQECYGVVGLEFTKLSDILALLFKAKNRVRGIKVETIGARIFLDVNVVIKYGVSISAVANSLRDTIKYNVEFFSGMVVDTINVHIIGVKI